MLNIEKQKRDNLKVQVEAALVRITQMDDGNALKRLHTNIQKNPDIDDLDRERLNEATILRLRAVSPALATRIGGPRDADARNFLEKLYGLASAKFDLSGNRVGQGVKTGGCMINGTRYVDVYISYKTSDKQNLSLAWLQDEIDSKPYLELLLRRMGADHVDKHKCKILYNSNEAAEGYLEELGKLIS